MRKLIPIVFLLCSCGTPHYDHAPEAPWTPEQKEALGRHLSTMMWLHQETGGKFLEPGAAAEYRPYRPPPMFDTARPMTIVPGKGAPTWESAPLILHAPYKY